MIVPQRQGHTAFSLFAFWFTFDFHFHLTTECRAGRWFSSRQGSDLDVALSLSPADARLAYGSIYHADLKALWRGIW